MRGSKATCSQRMLANQLGLSTATVSRALRKDTSVNAKTRDRVLKAARKLGWRPNFIVNTVMRDIRTKPGRTFNALFTDGQVKLIRAQHYNPSPGTSKPFPIHWVRIARQ